MLLEQVINIGKVKSDYLKFRKDLRDIVIDS